MVAVRDVHRLKLLIDYTHNQASSHAWSLRVEEHFHLAFPLLAWWLARCPSMPRFIAVCTGVVVPGIGLRSAVWLHDAARDPPRNEFIEDIDHPPRMRLDGLLVGVVLATLRVFRPARWTALQRQSIAIALAGRVVATGGRSVRFVDRVR